MGTQDSYDRLAPQYAERFQDEMDQKPFDRDCLDRLAQEVGGAGPICDLGCGPGQIARYLHRRGVQVLGVDLSPGMIAEAARLNPDIPFHQGDMLALPDEAGAWGGIAAFYCIRHPMPRLEQVGERVQPLVTDLRERAADDVIAVVTHNFVVKTLLCKLLGVELSNFRSFEVGLASLSTLSIRGTRTTVVALNDSCHLYALNLDPVQRSL